MDRNADNLILLLRSLAFDRTPTITDLDCSAICILANRHGIGNLLYPMFRLLPKEDQPDEQLLLSCKKTAFTAACRSVIQDRELLDISGRFFEKSIDMIPLKGIVLKELYNKPENRAMSDIDLLAPISSRAVINQIIIDMGFRVESYEKTNTDVYISPVGLKYELHFDLTEEAQNDAQASFLASLFHLAVRKDSLLMLPAEEHYIYVLLHTMKHFKNGGIGIRQIMDIWVCCHRQHLDRKRLLAYFEQLDLEKFARAMEKLADVWFSGEETDALSAKLGDYILSGMLFGTQSQRIENRMMKKKSNPFVYWIHRIFPSFQVMCSSFPSVRKLPILLPIFWFVRLFRGLFIRRESLSKEHQVVRATSKSALSEKEKLFEQCGVFFDN